MTIEQASQKDLVAILELQKRAFYGQALIYNDHTLPPLTQTIDHLREEFKHKTFYKLEENGRIIASVRCLIKERTLYVEKLIVEPDLQNKGTGTAIMRELESKFSSIVDRFELFTGHKSARNLHLYLKLGYREVRRTPLNDACDLIVLEKQANRNDE